MGEQLDKCIALEMALKEARDKKAIDAKEEEKAMDLMDRIWLTLTDEEHAFLNERK